MKIPTSQPMVIYGAGNCGRSTLRLLRERGYNVRGFLDRGELPKAGVLGVPCVHPDDEAAQKWKNEGAVLVVGIWNFGVDLSVLKRDLEAQNWTRVVLFPEVCDLWGAPIEPYWAAPRDFYDDAPIQEEIEAASQLWADKKSLELYNSSVEARRALDLEALNLAARGQGGAQYFPDDIPDWLSPKRFVDCGAFDGDTLRALPDSTEAALAFEPDARNFELLSGAAKEARFETYLWPCGVWSETTTLHFSGESGAASRLGGNAEDETEKQSVPVVALDDVAPRFAPDMMKFDIEGAEMPALLGARETIRKYRPALAICVYHRPQDLWQIPLWVSKALAPCKIYLRAHAFNGFDTVLYGVPA